VELDLGLLVKPVKRKRGKKAEGAGEIRPSIEAD
jgi:hypothetical protein